eukprot:1163336-Pyramimonas_sp.AAC.1
MQMISLWSKIVKGLKELALIDDMLVIVVPTLARYTTLRSRVEQHIKLHDKRGLAGRLQTWRATLCSATTTTRATANPHETFETSRSRQFGYHQPAQRPDTTST